MTTERVIIRDSIGGFTDETRKVRFAYFTGEEHDIERGLARKWIASGTAVPARNRTELASTRPARIRKGGR